MPLGNIVDRDDGWIYVNAIVLFLVFFTLPKNPTKSSVFLIITLGTFLLIHRISMIEGLHKFVFKVQLLDHKIQKRQAAPNTDYDDLSDNGQKEVDKIDEYFHSHAKTFSALMAFSLIHGLLFLLLLLEVMERQYLMLESYKFNMEYLVGALLMINLLFMYDNYKEIRRYLFVDLIEVYSKYNHQNGDQTNVPDKRD